ncbi:MAG: FHA domain-containing protein [Pseudomonadota bacterium]|nr:FHA domain-containing protein [Pseudomonadota bacterium]
MLARQVELVIRRDGHPERRMVLVPGTVVVGRADDNDVVLSEIGVSRRHARIAVAEGSIVVEDMGSGNGTLFQGERITRHLVTDGDEVMIDPFTLGFHLSGGDTTAEVTAGGDATMLVGGLQPALARLELVSAHRMDPRTFDIPVGGTLTLGRSEKASIVLPEPAASRLHADIGETAGSYWVRDRGSSNGTWVNGRRVREKVLADGDRVRIGTVELAFVAAQVPVQEEHSDRTEAFDSVMFTSAIAPSPADSGPPPNLAGPRHAGQPPTRPGQAFPPPAGPSLSSLKTPPPAEPHRAAPPPRPHAASTPAASTPAAPRSAGSDRPVPPPPSLPFAPKALGVPRPAPATLRPTSAAAPPAEQMGAPHAVELDFDVANVKARKGPKGRVTRRSTGFLSRPINQISVSVLVLAGLFIGARMVIDMASSILTPRSVASVAPPTAAPTTVTGGSSAGASAVGAPSASIAAPIAAPVTRVALDPVAQDEVAALMADGMRLFTEGKQFEAAAQFYKVQQVDPGNPDAERMGYVACEFIAMQRMYEGLTARSVSATQRTDAKTLALAAVVKAGTDGSAIGEAHTLLAAALELNPGDPELADAGAQLALRESSIARGAASRRQEKKQASLQDMVAGAQRDFDKGNLTKAVRQWEAVLAADPTRGAPQYYQAEEGIRNAKDQMKADSKKAYTAGLAAYKSGDLVTARSQLASTVKSDPYNDAAAAKLADVRKRLKEQASEIYKEARVLEDINQTDKALALYQKVLTYVDDSGDPLAGKAQGRMNALLK